MSDSHRTPVLIVGASLAGCCAALEVSRAGIPVMLVDRAIFPRRKACGEGLSARAVAALCRAGFDPRRNCTESVELWGYRVLQARGEIDLPSAEPILGIKRQLLDSGLLDAVLASPLVSLRAGTFVRAVERDDSEYRVQVGKDWVRARSVVIADGAASPTAARLGCRVDRASSPRVGSSSAWQVVEGALQSRVQVFPVQGGEVYLTPTGVSSVNVSILGNARFVAELCSVENLHAWIAQRCGVLGARLEADSLPMGAGPLNSRRRGAVIEGAFLVGDACETLDPVGGMGMAHAVETGVLAGRALLQGMASGDFASAALWYNREQRKVARSMRGFTRLTSWMLGTAAGRAVMPLAVASGVARSISQAAHGNWQGDRSPWSVLLGAAGATR